MNKINAVKAFKSLIYICLAIGIFLFIFHDFIFYPDIYKKFLSTKNIDRSIPSFIEADLGGMKIKIPRELGYINWKNWNGQGNDWDPNASKIKYEKTHLRSFAFRLKYPEMTGSEENKKNMNEQFHPKSLPYPDGSFWIDGSVTSGESYHLKDGEYFNYLYKYTSESMSNKFPSERYRKNPQNKFGLEVYELADVNNRGVNYRDQSDATDYYLYIKDGTIMAFGRCPPHPNILQECTLEFTLLPKSKTIVKIMFHHTQMEKWKEMMDAVRNFYFKFEVK